MNKLEEYKRRLLIGAKVAFDHNTTNGFYTKGIREGFDAAIALDLPVKFAAYIREVSTGSIDTLYLCKDLAKELSRDYNWFTEKELYQYWVKNILKFE